MSTVTPPERVAVFAATSLERRAAERHVKGAQIIECGVALSKIHGVAPVDVAISFGLAGGLRDAVPTGSLVIPYAVYSTSGEIKTCDEAWTQRLRAAAASLGYPLVDAPLLTSATIVSGAQRARWASDGLAAVDMETMQLPVERVAAVRVILDTPQRELSPEWVDPARALRNPRNWPQALWLARNAPRCAEIAAKVIAKALSS